MFSIKHIATTLESTTSMTVGTYCNQLFKKIIH